MIRVQLSIFFRRMEEGKMKKKIMSAVLSMVLVMTMLAGCASGGGGESTSESVQTTESEAAPDTAGAEETEAAGETAAAQENSGEVETISLLVAVTEGSTEGIENVIRKAEEALGIKIESEIPNTDADNLVKTRLASADMADLCVYNSGALLNTLNPAEYFVDLGEYEFMGQVDDKFKATVTVDGAQYGVPAYTSSVGAILYNREKYEQYNLEPPKTWEQFMANCEVLKEAGENALIGSFADAWTSQFPFLGDYYNVVAGAPDFTKEFESGKVKYATTESALQSFQKCSDLTPYYNEDYLATTYNDACDMLANGDGCQWVITSPAVSNIAVSYDKETADNIGVFPMPGNDENNNGMTVWEPAAFYVNKDADESKMEVIVKFLEFYISQEGIDAYSEVQLPNGPFCVKEYEIADEYVTEAVKQMQEYFDAGKTQVAQEFETAVKGSNCAAICQEVGTGQTTAEEAAKKYDEDCYKQAVQLGLGWEE